MREKTYLDLLEDPNVKHWYENLKRGSKVHGDLSLKRLKAFCTWSGMSPSEIVSKAGSDIESFQHVVEDYVSHLETSSKAPAYIANLLKPIRSWLEYRHGPPLSKIKITNSGSNITVENERVPTREELARIFRFLDPRERAAAAFIAFGGCRIETLGNYDGTDGLVVGDLPEMSLEGGTVNFSKIPAMVVVRSNLSKAGHRYFTFLSKEGCDYLKEYLEGRLAAGEVLTAESPVIEAYRTHRNRFLYATKVGDHIRIGVRKAGFDWRPYVLRAYCDTAFDIAESKGLISHPWRQFFMGHKGDIEARYSTNKGRLPPDMIEEMRATYKKCEPLFQTTGGEAAVSEDKMKETFRRQLLIVAGFNQDEIDKMNLLEMSDEEFQAVLRQGYLNMMAGNGAKQKVVGISEIEKQISQGWEFVALLPDERAIMKLPF